VSSTFGQAKGEEHRGTPRHWRFPFLTYFSGNGDTGFSKKIAATECSVAEAVSFSYRQSVAQSLSWGCAMTATRSLLHAIALRRRGDTSHSESSQRRAVSVAFNLPDDWRGRQSQHARARALSPISARGKRQSLQSADRRAAGPKMDGDANGHSSPGFLVASQLLPIVRWRDPFHRSTHK
jgi:hypothetical protein